MDQMKNILKRLSKEIFISAINYINMIGLDIVFRVYTPNLFVNKQPFNAFVRIVSYAIFLKTFLN